jgi:predicted nucleic acid-binding protein
MAAKWVLDCSAMAAAVLSEKEGRETAEILEQALEGWIQILVPALFWYEIANVLKTAVGNKRLVASQAQEILLRLKDLPIDTDLPGDFIVHRRIFDLAILHNLSAYDAAYLELAERFNATLKTFDGDLLKLRHRYTWIR